MVDFIQNCLDGLMIGAAYALLALGFTLIFGVMRRLNLSYGPSIMAGVFMGTLLYASLEAHPITEKINCAVRDVLKVRCEK